MHRLLNLLLVLGTTSIASPLLKRSNPDFSGIAGDAPFSVDQNTLAGAITCPNGSPTSSSPPVLLVHGTSSTGSETWGEGYVPALKAKGYTACYVRLPGRAMGDMQISSEYVAYGLHYISSLSGGLQTAVITHSQGGPVTQWALQFWPSTRSVTRAFIPLSPDFAGIDILSSNLSSICKDLQCQASIWQQSEGSNYYKALHAHDFEALVPTTVLWTKFDGVVVPANDNAQLPSAKVISVQQLCPLRLTNHLTMTIDAAAFSLALDALDHGGTASITRVLPKALGTCLRINASGMNLNVVNQLTAVFDDLVNGFLLGEPRESAEPAIKPYAT